MQGAYNKQPDIFSDPDSVSEGRVSRSWLAAAAVVVVVVAAAAAAVVAVVAAYDRILHVSGHRQVVREAAVAALYEASLDPFCQRPTRSCFDDSSSVSVALISS